MKRTICIACIKWKEKYLSVVELQGIISGETNIQTSRKKIGKWIAIIIQEEGVVAKW
jgi:hypothetical protein